MNPLVGRVARVVGRYERRQGQPCPRSALVDELQVGGIPYLDVEVLITDAAEQGVIYESLPGQFRVVGR